MLMGQLEEFQDLMRRVRAGSNDAARELLETYGPHVVRVVRRRMSHELRSRFDSLDFAQAVWASFYAQRSRWEEVNDPQALMGRLATMARNKVISEYRRRVLAQCRAIQRERTLEPRDESAEEVLVGGDPSPSQAFLAKDTWERLLANQSPLNQQVLRLRLAGLNCQEVGDRLSMNPRTVRRILKGIFEGFRP
jgi:RNA polymerase sigma factor (sigma-70 family)